MIGFIALPSFLVLVVLTLLVVRKRRGHNSARTLSDLTPVSGQWLADYRRGG